MLNTSSCTNLKAIKRLPLTPGQKRIWSILKHDIKNPVYNLISVAKISGKFDDKLFQYSLQKIVNKNSALRFFINSNENDVWGQIMPQHTVNIDCYDLTEIENELIEETIKKIATKKARKSYQYNSGPLFHASILKLRTKENIFIFASHHLVVDGWSLGIIMEAILNEYKYLSEQDKTLTDNKYEDHGCTDLYEKYLIDSEKYLHSKNHESSVDFWMNYLSNMEWTEILSDFPKNIYANEDKEKKRKIAYCGVTRRYTFSELNQLISDTCKSKKLTRYQLFIGIFILHLGLTNSNNDITIATLSGNRVTREHQNLIAFIANTFALRHKFEYTDTLNHFMDLLKCNLQAINYHNKVSLNTLSKKIPEITKNNPSILFSMQNNPIPSWTHGGLNIEMLDIDYGISKFDISLYLAEINGNLEFWVEYNNSKYHQLTIDNLVKNYIQLLKIACKKEVWELPINSLPWKVNNPSILHGASSQQQNCRLIAEMFLSTAVKNSEKPALIIADKKYTFKQLINQIIHILNQFKKAGCHYGDTIALCVERDIQGIAAIWGCLIAGYVFIPLSRLLSQRKQEEILLHCQANWYFTDNTETAPQIKDWRLLCKPVTNIFDEKTNCANLIKKYGPKNKRMKIDFDLLAAYILYTSGTTGAPKGVVVNQHSLKHFFHSMDERINFSVNDTWLAITDLGFDIALLELIWSLSRGLTVKVLTLQALISSPKIAPDSNLQASTQLPDLSLFYFANNKHYPSSEYQNLLNTSAKLADTLGFHSLWCPERHFSELGGYFSNPSVTTAWLLAQTENINICAGSVVGPLHHTARIAEDWQALQSFSTGRVGLSLASGWNPKDFILSNHHIDDRHLAVTNQIKEIKALWDKQTVAYSDKGKKYYSVNLPNANANAPILWLTVSKDPKLFRWAAEQKLNILTHMLEQDEDQLLDNIAIYKNTWYHLHGSNDSVGRVTLMLHTYIAPNNEIAYLDAKPYLQEYFSDAGSLLGLRLAQEERKLLKNSNYEEFYSEEVKKFINNKSLICSSKEALKRVAYFKSMGVDEIACFMDFGVATNKILKNIEALSNIKQNAVSHNRKKTHFQCTPSVASSFDSINNKLGHIDHWYIGGETLNKSLLRKLQKNCINTEILNMYGPTETTVWASCKKLKRPSSEITIGEPLSNYQVYILSPFLQPLPKGCIGNIYIAGESVANGYWKNPTMTAISFIPDPLKSNGARMYDTGDIGRINCFGELEFLGRKAEKIKFNGRWIDKSYISDCIKNSGYSHTIKDCYIYIRNTNDTEQELIAFIVCEKNEKKKVDENYLKNLLSKKLEFYEIPKHIITIENLPLNNRHKVDLSSLLKIYKNHLNTLKSFKNQPLNSKDKNSEYKKLQSIWLIYTSTKNVLNNDNFFSSGGNSLKVVKLINHCNMTFGVNISLEQFYRKATFDNLYYEISKQLIKPSSNIDLHIEFNKVNRGKAYYPVSYSQRSMLLLEELRTDNSYAYHDTIGIKLYGEVDENLIQCALDCLVKKHQILRTGYDFHEKDYIQKIIPNINKTLNVIDADFIKSGIFVEGKNTIDSNCNLLLPFISKRFNLKKADVFRALYIKNKNQTAMQESIVILVFHHIVTDGWTLTLLLQDLLSLYTTCKKNLQNSCIESQWQYIDYVNWQKKQYGIKKENLYKFWKNYCKNFVPSRLPSIQIKEKQSVNDACYYRSRKIEEKITLSLEEISEKINISLFSILAAAVFIVQRVFCEQRDVSFATDMANRTRSEFFNIAGMMVNQVIVRQEDMKIDVVDDYLISCHRNSANIIANQELPYEELIRLIQPERKTGRDPLFDIKFVLNQKTKNSLSDQFFTAEEIYIPPLSPKFGLLFNCWHSKGDLSWDISYDNRLFDNLLINAIEEALADVLSGIIEKNKVTELELMASKYYKAYKTKEKEQLKKNISKKFQLKRRTLKKENSE